MAERGNPPNDGEVVVPLHLQRSRKRKAIQPNLPSDWLRNVTMASEISAKGNAPNHF